MKTVFISGGFDPLHEDHLSHIQKARKLGDVLIIATHRDETMVQKKGFCYESLNTRVGKLYEQPEVDLVVVAKDADGLVVQTLRSLRPNIYAKGKAVSPQEIRQEEVNVCNEIGCKIVYGVGGSRDMSSSRIAASQGLEESHIPPVKDVTIVVPTYNEEECIGKTIEGLLALADDTCEIIVVDNCSTDRTTEIALRYPVRLIQQPINMGKGTSIRTGIQQARGKKVIWIDADDTYPVSLIPEMVKTLDVSDVVVCSRVSGKEHMPAFNRFGNWLFKVLIKGIYGFKGSDPCTGLYGAHKEHLIRMHLKSEQFAIEPEISIKVGRMRLATVDIPIQYRPRVGQSKLNPIKVGFEDMWTIAKLIGWREK